MPGDPGGPQAGLDGGDRPVHHPRHASLYPLGQRAGVHRDDGQAWITTLGVRPAYIEPDSPWENGYVESFNGKFRDELLACEAFNTMAEAKVLIEQWRVHYNTVRPHSSLGY